MSAKINVLTVSGPAGGCVLFRDATTIESHDLPPQKKGDKTCFGGNDRKDICHEEKLIPPPLLLEIVQITHMMGIKPFPCFTMTD